MFHVKQSPETSDPGAVAARNRSSDSIASFTPRAAARRGSGPGIRRTLRTPGSWGGREDPQGGGPSSQWPITG